MHTKFNNIIEMKDTIRQLERKYLGEKEETKKRGIQLEIERASGRLRQAQKNR